MDPRTVDELRGALLDVARLLERRGVQARVYLTGGGAMAFAYDADRLTRDLDVAVTAGHSELFAAVHEVAAQRGWMRTWLNDQVTVYLPRTADAHGSVVLDHPGLVVTAASPRHLLAMKARSARESDIGDARRLLVLCGSPSPDDVDDIVAGIFDGERLGERQRRWVEDVIDTTPTPSIHI